MCGRYAFYSPAEAVSRLFPVEEAPAIVPRYNIAPTQFTATIRQRDAVDAPSVTLLRWGLVPFWAKDKAIGNRMINARGETVHDKPAFRAAFRKRRCLVLADGFYEWQKTPDGKVPQYIQLASGEPFAMAGLWESWQDGDAEQPLETFTIVTTAANDALREVHDRMPVILPPDTYATWLDPANDDAAALRALLVPFDGDAMTFRAVSTAVNSPRNDDPSLLEAV